jgi:hypothetical protein
MKRIRNISVLLVLLSATAVCAQAQDSNTLVGSQQPDLSAITIRTPYGFWYPSNLFYQPPNVDIATSYAGISIPGGLENPPILGHFDKNGKVVNGSYVVVFYADLYTAPITKLWFNNFGWPTEDQPIVSGIATYPDGTPLGGMELAIGATNIGTQIRGVEGTVFLGVALLTRANQSPDKAWGATTSHVIRIDDTIPNFPYGDFIRDANGNITFTTASLTVGGAAHFKRH